MRCFSLFLISVSSTRNFQKPIRISNKYSNLKNTPKQNKTNPQGPWGSYFQQNNKKSTNVPSLFDTNYTKKPTQKNTFQQSSPYMHAINTVMQAVGPVLGSLCLPDIQPALDLITMSFSSICSQITSLISTSISQVQMLLNDKLACFAPNVTCIITEANNCILNNIMHFFDIVNTQIAFQIYEITQAECDFTDSNITEDNTNMLNQILLNIGNTEFAVESCVKNGMSSMICEVINSITDANNKICTEITESIADPCNTCPILPTLSFADPEKISYIITNDSYAMSACVQQLMEDSLTEIYETICKTASDVSSEEELELQKYNLAIYEGINAWVTMTIDGICKSIAEITKMEIDLITQFMNENSVCIEITIDSIFQNIKNGIEEIINCETPLLICSLKNLIICNNEVVLGQVGSVFCTQYQ